jgi:type I restriction enzyme, S subunit
VTARIETPLRKLFASSTPGDWGPQGTPDDGVPVLRSTNFRNDGTLDYAEVAYRQIHESRLEKRRIKKGTILIEKSGGSPKQAAGRAVFCDSNFNGTASNFIQILTVADEYCARFVAYLLQHLYHVGLVQKYQQQTTGIINFKLDEYLREVVPVPARKVDQTKIADILSALDMAIAQTEALISKKHRIKIGLMQDLLARGLDKSGNLRSATTHQFGDSALGRIPMDWCVASVGELFEQRRERGKPGLSVMSVVMEHGLIDRTSVDRRVESKLPPEGHALVLNGDIAYNMMRMWQGVLGRAHFDCLVSPAYVVLKPRPTIDSCFAEWLFRDSRAVQRFRRASRGVVDDRLRLYPQDLFAIKFAVPRSLDEQIVIGQRLEDAKAHIATEVARLEKMRLLRAGLMYDLLSGRKSVAPLLETVGADAEHPD